MARAIVLRQLAGAPKSRAQLRTKLLQRGCAADVADEVLDRMGEIGLVDDAGYADLYVRSKQATRGLARSALAHELRRNGIAEEVAADVLDTIPDAAEEARARVVVQARLPRLHGLERPVQTRRLAGLLARKGYPTGLALRVIRDALADLPEHRRD